MIDIHKMSYVDNNGQSLNLRPWGILGEFRGNVAIPGSLVADVGGRALLVPTGKENEYRVAASGHRVRWDDNLEMVIVELGSMSFIVDWKTGQKLSDGFFGFVKKEGKIYGKHAVSEEEIQLYPRGNAYL